MQKFFSPNSGPSLQNNTNRLDLLLKEFSDATPLRNDCAFSGTTNSLKAHTPSYEISRSHSSPSYRQNQTNSSALSFIRKRTASQILTCTALYNFTPQNSR